MTEYSEFLLFIVSTQIIATILATAMLRGAKLKAGFFAFGACLALANIPAALSGMMSTDGTWVAYAGYVALLAMHPLSAACVFAILRYDWGKISRPFVLLAVASVASLSVAGLYFGWGPKNVYGTYVVSLIPVIWLAFALAETLASWLQSALKGELAFICTLAIVILILTGPIYSLELGALGFNEALGSVPAATLAFIALFLAGRKASFLPFVRPRVSSMARYADGIQTGLHFLDEKRPKYVAEFARRRADAGLPTWVFLRSESEDAKQRYGSSQLVRIPSHRQSALRIAKTIEYLSQRYPNSMFLIEDLSFILCNSGWRECMEALMAASNCAKAHRCVVLASLSCLTRAEVRELITLPSYYHRLPAPENEIAAIAERQLGPAAIHIFRMFCSSKKMRIEDFRMHHIEEFSGFMAGTLMRLSREPGDTKVLDSSILQMGALVSELENYRTQSLRSVTQGPWPSASVSRRDQRGWLVKATDFDFEDKPGEDKAEYGTKARLAFEEALGERGTELFEKTLRIMGVDENEVEPEDFPALYKTTAELLRLLEDHETAISKIDKMLERSSELKEWLEVAKGVGNG